MKEEQPKMHRSRDGEALWQACEREGCPVCLVTLERMERVMDFWQYEWVSEMENRQVLIRSKGFCARHTWQLTQLPKVSAPFALAMVYRSIFPDLLEEIERDLAQTKVKQQGKRGGFWSRLWKRKRVERADTFFQACPFCQRQAEIEQVLTQEMLNLLALEEFQERLRGATGFCLPHFTRLLDATTRHAELRASLLAAQRACLRHTMEELEELVRKHDYRFLQEPRGEEMTSWRRAVELLVGNPGVR